MRGERRGEECEGGGREGQRDRAGLSQCECC